MTKLANPFFLDEFHDYLLVNGFRATEFVHSSNTHCFYKDDIVVEISRDTVTVSARYSEEPSQQSAGYAQQASFTGLASLDTFKFMILMHITGAIPLKHFLHKATKKEDTEQDLFQKMASIFAPRMPVVH